MSETYALNIRRCAHLHRLPLRGGGSSTLRSPVASPEAERWARFTVREQLRPAAAFDILHDGAPADGCDLVDPPVARLRRALNRLADMR